MRGGLLESTVVGFSCLFSIVCYHALSGWLLSPGPVRRNGAPKARAARRMPNNYLRRSHMKRAIFLVAVVFTLVKVAGAFAATPVFKLGNEVYACNCPEANCPCQTISKKEGKCPCGTDMIKAKVTGVVKGDVTLMARAGKRTGSSSPWRNLSAIATAPSARRPANAPAART